MTEINPALLDILRTVASALGVDLRERLVFLGGSVTALLITDRVTLKDVRTTDDVDLIINLAGYPGWTELLEQLRAKGFSESAQDSVICRLRLGRLKVDFMPDDPNILGFSNRWYAKAIDTANTYRLSDELNINLIAPEMFIATKLEAYLSRGNDDLFSSKDAEDILLIIDGRPELIDEISASDEEVRRFISEQIKAMIDNPDFYDFVEGNVRSPEGRSDIVRDRFLAISNLR